MSYSFLNPIVNLLIKSGLYIKLLRVQHLVFQKLKIASIEHINRYWGQIESGSKYSLGFKWFQNYLFVEWPLHMIEDLSFSSEKALSSILAVAGMFPIVILQ